MLAQLADVEPPVRRALHGAIVEIEPVDVDEGGQEKKAEAGPRVRGAASRLSPEGDRGISI